MRPVFNTTAKIPIPETHLYFKSQAQRDCVLDNHVHKHTVEAPAKKNLVFMA
ncbi:MAG: hypothetical protein IPH51_06760 [Rubrivivax sp.]|nr:hypothetical protein [Rubrivivax sp.]